MPAPVVVDSRSEQPQVLTRLEFRFNTGPERKRCTAGKLPAEIDTKYLNIKSTAGAAHELVDLIYQDGSLVSQRATIGMNIFSNRKAPGNRDFSVVRPKDRTPTSRRVARGESCTTRFPCEHESRHPPHDFPRAYLRSGEGCVEPWIE